MFIPSTPTPFTGYMLMVKKDEVYPTNMSVEEAVKFIVSGGIVVPGDDAAASDRSKRGCMRLSTLLSEELVLADMSAGNKDEAIATLLALIGRRFPLLDMETIAAAIDERERVENTSYGHGYAFPHARTDAVERMYIAVGVSKRGLSDKTPDDVTLRVVCLMLTPSNISQLYLQTLSAFARFARDPQNLKRLLDARGVAGRDRCRSSIGCQC